MYYSFVSLARMPRGSEVRIRGLTGRRDLNGRGGTVAGLDPRTGRYEVDVADGPRGAAERVKVKPENLAPLLSTPGENRETSRRFRKLTARERRSKLCVIS